MMDYQEKHAQPLGFGDFSTFAANHMMQGFDPHHDLYGLHPGMEMMGIPASTSKPPNPNPSPSPSPWPVDDSSLLCLLPQERTQLQQTTQGLALSLCNPAQDPPQQQLFMEDGRLFQLPQGANYLKRSRYLIAAQQLLVEVCNLGTDAGGGRGTKRRPTKPGQWEEGRPTSSLNQSLLQLQKRKAKLLFMLEEVDKKYRKYCEQMRAVVASFEAVAGEGAATVYSTLASKAMSRHFRCLRDGIIGQIHATKTAMGDKDAVTLETTRGETPRLKLLDQHLRQQRAFQQVGTVEGQPWRPQRGLPDRAVSVLRAWLFEHFLHPYPSDIDKHILARQTGLSRSQVSNWFINARVRLWKPMVEEMYMDELKEQDKQSSHASTGLRHDGNSSNPNPSPYSFDGENRKPDLGQLPTDADSLASVISSARHAARRDERVPRGGDGFGAVDLDFSSYNNFGSLKFGGDVSLTLGLKHHKGSGMTLSFSREQMGGGDVVQPAQFSIVEGSLVGDQLLHDLAS